MRRDVIDTRIAFRWLVAIVGLIAVLGATFLLWKGLDRRRSAADRELAWGEQLDWYLDLLSQDDGRMTFLEASARATRPERFVADMSRSTWRSDAALVADTSADARALAYPPTELYCALLTHAYTTDPDLNVPDDREVVFVARHQDRDRSVWVGHRIADRHDDAATRKVLNTVGCPLEW